VFIAAPPSPYRNDPIAAVMRPDGGRLAPFLSTMLITPPTAPSP